MFVTNNWKHFYGQYCLISETTLRPLVLPIRVVPRWRCIWSIGGMIRSREFEVLGEERPPTAILSAKDFTWREASPTATIFATDLTWSGPGWHAGLRGEGRATDPFSKGTPIKQSSSCSGFYPPRSVRKRKILSVFPWILGQPLIFQTPSKNLLLNPAKDVT